MFYENEVDEIWLPSRSSNQVQENQASYDQSETLE
jgi:hypothetical protein